MRKKIIGVSVVVALLAMLCAQSVAAQPPTDITVYAWTDKPQYNPGDSGVLTISILNERDEPVEITRIYIEYPWFVYDADEDTWLGNATFEGTPLAILTSKGGDYYNDVDFTIPTDGRAPEQDYIRIEIYTSAGNIILPLGAPLNVASLSYPMEIVDLDLWMTSLIVAVVICTIILAIAVFLSRRAPAPRFVAPPPPPKPKAKAT